MTLLIDNRTGSKKLAASPHLADISALLPFETSALPGDIMFTGNSHNGPIDIGAEIKRIDSTDYVSSVRTGRLFGIGGQIDRMLDAYEMTYLITYPEVRCHPNESGPLAGAAQYRSGYRTRGKGSKKVRWRTLGHNGRNISYTSLLSVEVECSALNVYYINCRDFDDLGLYLRALYSWWTRDWSSHKLTRCFNLSRFDRRLSSSKRRAVSLLPDKTDPALLARAEALTIYDGVRYERALRIASLFDGLTRLQMLIMIKQNPTILESVKGIGPGLAQSIGDQIKSL